MALSLRPRALTAPVMAPPPVAAQLAPAPADHLATARAQQVADPNSYINSRKWTVTKLEEHFTANGWLADAGYGPYVKAFLDELRAQEGNKAAKPIASAQLPLPGAVPAKRGRKPAVAAPPVLPAPQSAAPVLRPAVPRLLRRVA